MWFWTPQIIEPVIVLKGVAFKDLVGEDVRIYVQVNGGEKRKAKATGPSYIPGRVVNGQFMKVSTSPLEGFYHFELDPVIIFGKDDIAKIEYDEGGRQVIGYPEYEIRRVIMG